MQLSPMQKRYIWLAGSFPKAAVMQGRGARTRVTYYAFNDAADELYIFGYGNPLWFLERRRLFRKLQAPLAYTLTEDGDAAFQMLLLNDEGIDLNKQVRETRLKEVA